MNICHTPDFMYTYIYIIVVRDRYNNYVQKDFYHLINHKIIITTPPERRVWKKKKIKIGQFDCGAMRVFARGVLLI